MKRKTSKNLKFSESGKFSGNFKISKMKIVNVLKLQIAKASDRERLDKSLIDLVLMKQKNSPS